MKPTMLVFQIETTNHAALPAAPDAGEVEEAREANALRAATVEIEKTMGPDGTVKNVEVPVKSENNALKV